MAIKWKFPARTATVHCSDGCRAKRDENGGLLCAYGCVACGACVEACRFGAVQINDLGCAEVDEEKCIGCGACTAVCTAGNLTSFNFRRVHTLVRRGEYQGAYEEMNKCMLCGKCRLVCPRGINTRGVVMLIKRKLGDF